MDLVVQNTEKVFDVNSIKKGFLISAKHKIWSEEKTGIVSRVDKENIRVLHHPHVANVTCFFDILLEEVLAGEWEIRWSENLTSVEEYPKDGGAGE